MHVENNTLCFLWRNIRNNMIPQTMNNKMIVSLKTSTAKYFVADFSPLHESKYTQNWSSNMIIFFEITLKIKDNNWLKNNAVTSSRSVDSTDFCDSFPICLFIITLLSHLDGTQYLYRTDECKFLLIGQHDHVHVKESPKECH